MSRKQSIPRTHAYILTNSSREQEIGNINYTHVRKKSKQQVGHYGRMTPLTQTAIHKPKFRCPHQEEVIMSHQTKYQMGTTKEQKNKIYEIQGE